MKTFIKAVENDDDWYFKSLSTLDFSRLKTMDYCSFPNKRAAINLRINASEEAKEPSKTQIKTLDFILENQEKILRSIFNFNQQFIYPIYNESIDIEEEEIVHEQAQLSRVYGIRGVEIPNFKALNAFYFLIRFDFRYDDEHGFYLLFKDSSVIDFFGEGDKNYDAIDLYQNGLINKNGAALEIRLYKIPFQLVLKRTCHFKEHIKFSLEKGAYRISIKSNENQYRTNFHTSMDLEKFSLEQILSIK